MKKKLWLRFLLYFPGIIIIYTFIMYVSPFVQFLGFAEYDYTYEELGEAVQELLPGRGFVRYEEHGAARQELPGGGSVSLDAEIEILSIEKNYSTAMVVCTDGNRIFAVGFQGGGIPTHYRMDNIGLLPFDTVVDVDGRYPLMVKYTLSPENEITGCELTVTNRFYRWVILALADLGLAYAGTFGREKYLRQKEKELEYEERRKDTKSFAEMVREEKEAKQREQEQDANPK